MPLMRRRPLLRAAAIGGGAYHMGRVNAERREQEAYQNQRINDLESRQMPTAVSPSGGVSSDAIQRLQELGQLHEQGVLTDEEFAQQKQKLLAG